MRRRQQWRLTARGTPWCPEVAAESGAQSERQFLELGGGRWCNGLTAGLRRQPNDLSRMPAVQSNAKPYPFDIDRPRARSADV